MRKKLRVIFKYFSIIFILLIILLLSIIYSGGPKLNPSTDTLVKQVLNESIVEQINGDSSTVFNDGVKIWYESIPPSSEHKGDILLFMGIANDALGWPNEFLQALSSKGYRLIRFDYRSTGLSDWISDFDQNPYTLSDLSNDAIAILNDLGIEKCHLLGVSLGGMVAQQFAIDHKNRSLSLISIMSSGNIVDQTLPGISFKTISKLLRTTLKYNIISNTKNSLKSQIVYRKILQGEAKYELNTKDILDQVWFNLSERKGYNYKSSDQHQKATLKSGSRYKSLQNLEIPMLIIHGEKDPLIPVEHGRKLANLLPKAKYLEVKNMGHDIASIHLKIIEPSIIGFLDTE